MNEITENLFRQAYRIMRQSQISWLEITVISRKCISLCFDKQFKEIAGQYRTMRL